MSLHSSNLSRLFPSSPAYQGHSLPFAIDEMEFSNWLKTLSDYDELPKCHQIFQVLQILNNKYPPERKSIPGRTRLFFLEKLGLALMSGTNLLTQFPISADIATRDASENELAKSQICVWSSLELANAYALLSEEDWFKDEQYYSITEKTMILANGIQAMGRALLYISQTYTKPQLHFWSRCFQFYRLAQINQLLDSATNPALLILENAFKRLLVFYLCNANQFSVQEMRTIYDMLSQFAHHAGLLKSVPKKKYKGIPSINLKGNGPPVIVDENTDVDNYNPDRLYIATVTVASKILEATYDKRARYLPTDRLMLLRLAKTLTLNEQRKDTRQAAQGMPLGVVGFENIIDYLRQKDVDDKNSQIEITEVGKARPGEIRDLDLKIINPVNQKNAEVEKAAHQSPGSAFKVIEFSDPADIWKTHKSHPIMESNVRLLDKSAKGYGLLWTDILIKPKVGSIIGVLHKTMTIGLIRWMVQSKETGMFIGVELMGSGAVAVKVYNPGFPDEEVNAVYLPGGDVVSHAPSLIIMNRTFKPAEFIFLRNNNKNVRYRLIKQLHLTTYINHLEVVRSN